MSLHELESRAQHERYEALLGRIARSLELLVACNTLPLRGDPWSKEMIVGWETESLYAEDLYNQVYK